MLAFMAYPPQPSLAAPAAAAAKRRGSSTSSISCHDSSTGALRMCESGSRTSGTTTSMENDVPPGSVLSLSTEASSNIVEDDGRPPLQPQHVTVTFDPLGDAEFQRKATQCCHQDDHHKEEAPSPAPASEQPPPSKPDGRSFFHHLYIEKLYENTVERPCQTVTMCEVEHMDLFMVCNCQQPLSFLGLGGHHHHHHDQHLGESSRSLQQEEAEEEEQRYLGAYAVPRSCEYCGSPSTRQCQPGTCQRPKLFFHKKRPPFSPRDSSLWDPITDEAILTTELSPPAVAPARHRQRHP